MTDADSHPRVFFDLPPEVADPDSAAAVIVPVPYDRTASWLRGAAGGPEAILEASQYLEVWDIETASEPWRRGIAAAEPVLCDQGPEELAEDVEARVGSLLDHDQLPVVLGGEHSITIGAVRAAQRRFDGLSVLQIDAHADTRESYADHKRSGCRNCERYPHLSDRHAWRKHCSGTGVHGERTDKQGYDR